MPHFIPGLRLGELFYREAVKPVLERRFPGLRYSAALLGPGSEVLCYDTPMSRDHNWGPRALLFLAEKDVDEYGPRLAEVMRHELPPEVHGYPTNFTAPDAEDTVLLQRIEVGPVNHRVAVTSVARFVRGRLGIDSYPRVDAVDWLLCSDQRLLEVTAGAVYEDGLGEVEPRRQAFTYYPRDVWLYLLAAQWKRISQLEPFVGRCGDVGDDSGSALVAASQVRDVMRLCFLMERRYAPYSKWFGTAFARLHCAGELLPTLEQALRAATWRERERHLCDAYSAVAAMHNRLGITDPLSTGVARFHDRPFLVIDGERFSRAIRDRIKDEGVLRLPPDIGSVDQWVDSTDVLSYNEMRMRLKAVYRDRDACE